MVVTGVVVIGDGGGGWVVVGWWAVVVVGAVGTVGGGGRLNVKYPTNHKDKKCSYTKSIKIVHMHR